MNSSFEQWCNDHSKELELRLRSMPVLWRAQAQELMKIAFEGGWVRAVDQQKERK